MSKILLDEEISKLEEIYLKESEPTEQDILESIKNLSDKKEEKKKKPTTRKRRKRR